MKLDHDVLPIENRLKLLVLSVLVWLNIDSSTCLRCSSIVHDIFEFNLHLLYIDLPFAC